MEYIFQMLDEFIEGDYTKQQEQERVPVQLFSQPTPPPVKEKMYSEYQVDRLVKARVAELEKQNMTKYNQLYTEYLCLAEEYDAIKNKSVEYQDKLTSSTSRIHDLEQAIDTIMTHADEFKNELASYTKEDGDNSRLERNYIYV